MYRLIKNNPQKYTIHSLVKYYNEKHTEKLCKQPLTIYKTLKRLYGDEIDVYLSYGFHSNEEYQFYNTLKFYLPELGEKIVLGKKFDIDDHYIVFDLFINQSILIEYDSTGTYHTNTIDQDLFKETFAKENGYIFLRLTKDDILNPDTITKIRNLIHD